MEENDPPIGTKAICAMCSNPIIFIGPYWDHPGENKPRHPATPERVVEEEEERITPELAIRSLTLDLMMRRRDWEDKDDPNGVAAHMSKLIDALDLARQQLGEYHRMKDALAVLKASI